MHYITRALCVFPVLVVTGFYATWFAGRLALGYWPRPSLDDPKSIEGRLMWLYDVTAVLIVIGVPLFLLIALGVSIAYLFRKQKGWDPRMTELVIASALFIGLVIFVRWDPQSVVAWYFD